MQFFTTILYAIILMTSVIYVWHKLLKRKMNFKNYKLYLSLFGMVSTSIINNYLVSSFIKVVFVTLILIFFFKFLFNENFAKTIMTPIFCQMIALIAETVFLILIITIFKLDVNELKDEFLSTFIVNIATGVNLIIITSIPFVKTLYELTLFVIEKINKKFLMIMSLFIIGISNILVATTYYEVDLRILIIINVVFTMFCFILVLYSFKMQSNYNKVSDKYDVAINSLTDYENMMSTYRVANHENKNLLLTIRAMILNKEKDIPKYIDSIIKKKYEDNERLLFETSVIPSGGLRATIYSEILKLKENKIKYLLNIDKELKTVDLIELDTDTVIDICKIIGVFIDNAIEEVNKLKVKNVQISLYLENEFLNIKVSNNYSGKINTDKIFTEGYTTKGKGHGYGLALVKKIIDSNANFVNKIEISKDVFSQLLSIKIKKAH